MKKIAPVIFAIFFFTSCVSDKNEKQETTNAADSTQKITNPFVPNTAPVQNGDYEVRYKNGLLKAKGFYKNGEREGQWVSWYENGQLWSEGIYKNGLKNGKSTAWYENGKKRYEGFFTNDVKSGKWKYWNETGKLVQEVDCGEKKY